jgi:hypothetical protein
VLVLAKVAFDPVPDLAAGACQMARDGRFVLAENQPDLSQREILGIVTSEAETISRSKARHDGRDCSTDRLQVP